MTLCQRKTCCTPQLVLPTRTGTPYSQPLTPCVSLVTLRNQAEPGSHGWRAPIRANPWQLRRSTAGTGRFRVECCHFATVRHVADAAVRALQARGKCDRWTGSRMIRNHVFAAERQQAPPCKRAASGSDLGLALGLALRSSRDFRGIRHDWRHCSGPLDDFAYCIDARRHWRTHPAHQETASSMVASSSAAVSIGALLRSTRAWMRAPWSVDTQSTARGPVLAGENPSLASFRLRTSMRTA